MRAKIAVGFAHSAALGEAEVLADLFLPEDVVLPELLEPAEQETGKLLNLYLCVDPVL